MYPISKPRGNKKIINSYAVMNLQDDLLIESIKNDCTKEWKRSSIVSGYGDGYNSEIRTNTEQQVKSLKSITSVMHVIDTINRDFWNFSLTGLDLWTDHPSVFRYKKGQKFDWHYDFTHIQPTRKLGFSLQLSPSEDYEGGDLEIFGCEKDKKFREKGALIVFPSYVWHRVTEVKEGERIAMVGWIHGPTFS